jgi:hypothetical protein
VVIGGKRSGISQQPKHGDFVHAEHPASAGDAVALDQSGKDRGTAFGAHLVHDVIIAILISISQEQSG